MSEPVQTENPLLAQRETINPYITVMRILLERLIWDINPRSWSSRQALRKLRNTHVGEKAVIMCNGPSLLKVDFSLLKGHYVFGLNKINLLFDKTDFRPSCIVAINKLVVEQNAPFFNETKIPLFIDSVSQGFIKNGENTTFLHNSHFNRFARDCSVSVFHGYTVTYVAMQLAYHMGFSEVALVGCDHRFSQSGPAGKAVTSGESDPSHFDPRYFAGGVKWQLPDLFNSEVCYKLAMDVFQASGRRLVNCTDGGDLELLPRLSLVDFLRD